MGKSEHPPGLPTVRRWAALLGHVVKPIPEDHADRLDVLAELGGEATAAQIIRHEGVGTPPRAHARMRTMMDVGAVERLGIGRPADPYRYRLTPVGELLRLHR